MSQEVYVNRTLNMKKIQAVGFDMDLTLVEYNSINFEKETHRCIIQRLIQQKKYPHFISELKFDYQKVIRGLVIDNQKGNFLKLSRYRSIRKIFNGEQSVQYKSRREVYSTDYIDFDVNHPQFSFIESHFLIAPSVLYMQLVEMKKTKSLPDLDKMFTDIIEVNNLVHAEGDVKKLVIKGPEKYIKSHPEIALGLEKLIQHGKTLFLVTNSDPNYTSFLMNHTITPYLKHHSSWKDLFKVIVTSAQKPYFFYEKRPFQVIDPKTFEVISETNSPSEGMYQHGCAVALTKYFNTKDYEILYIGDQVYTDVVLLKKTCGWRTALVISELSTEEQQIKNNKSLYKKMEELMSQKISMELQVEALASDQIENNHQNNKEKIKDLMKETEQIDLQLQNHIQESDKNFNPYWGEIMRVGAEESLFASQAERFSCIYMSHIKDFLSQSPRRYYRSKKRLLPHEM